MQRRTALRRIRKQDLMIRLRLRRRIGDAGHKGVGLMSVQNVGTTPTYQAPAQAPERTEPAGPDRDGDGDGNATATTTASPVKSPVSSLSGNQVDIFA
jgi:hypothetical protein